MTYPFPKPKRIKKDRRKKILVLFTAFIFFIYVVRLGQMQILDSDKYRAKADMLSARTARVKAARGEILDRYGRPLAVNREGYNVVFDASFLPKDKINETILTLIEPLKAEGNTWRDKLPFSQTAPYTFTDKQDDVSALKKKLELTHYATAANCYDAMVEKYTLERYSDETRRALMGIRYTMDSEDFSVSLPYIFAEDISESVRAKIKESSFDLPGVIIETSPVREYVATDIAPHIIGNTGPIYAEDWEELKSKGYSLDDQVGKMGVELSFEDYLRGTDGTNKIVQNKYGETIDVVTEKKPVPGNTVKLTIDKKIQKVAQDSLEKTIKKMQADKIGAKAGAVVAFNVNTGEVIAAANYPSYDMKTYSTDYEKLAKDPGNPLFDRAFTGGYAPGSTFKPAMAALGLQTGKIKAGESLRCTQTYHYGGMTYNCTGYHGSLNVVEALSVSCNSFFYETGRRCGIDIMNNYCKQLGLGTPTGIEVPESTGILAGPTYRQKLNKVWYPGDTLQAAIGQSDNLFTPLQLSVYTGTLANGGSRYQAHLLHEVKNYSLDKTVVSPFKKVLGETGLSDSALDVVKKGMLSAAFEGTASSVFGDYRLRVGGKTGTAQVDNIKEHNNGVFISFAPYENPELAVAVVIERGFHGYLGAPIVKDIYDAYFFGENEKYVSEPTGSLLP